jgi:hypothetical protein
MTADLLKASNYRLERHTLKRLHLSHRSLGSGSSGRIHDIELRKTRRIDRLEAPVRTLLIFVDRATNPNAFGQLPLLEEADNDCNRRVDS